MSIAPTSLTKQARSILSDLLAKTSEVDEVPGVDATYYRARSPKAIPILDALETAGLLERKNHQTYLLTLLGLTILQDAKAKQILAVCKNIYPVLKRYYVEDAKKPINISTLATDLNLSRDEVVRALVYLRDAPIWGGYSTNLRDASATVQAGESILKYNDFTSSAVQLWDWRSQNNPTPNPLVYRSATATSSTKRNRTSKKRTKSYADKAISVATSGLSDSPARIEQDALGYSVYSSAIVDFLTHKNTKAPFSLAITGPWGAGKTTLLSWIENEIKKRGYPTVQFSPWKHNQQDEVWASFAQAIVTSLITSPWKRIQLRLKRLEDSLPSKTLKYSVAAALIIAAISITSSWLIGTDYLYGLLALVPILAQLLPAIWKALRSPLLGMLSSIKGPNYNLTLGFQKEFEDDLSRLIKIATKKAKPLFIFVDDLDRAPPPIPVKLLEAMNILIGKEHCIFVVGLDLAIVGASIEAEYLPVIERLNTSRTAFSGIDFIEKLIQLEFALPSLTDMQLDAFLRVLLNRNEPGLRSSVPASSPEPTVSAASAADISPAPNHSDQTAPLKFDEDSATFTDSIYWLSRTLPRNPRTIKRFINQFRLLTYVAARRGLFSTDHIDLDGLGSIIVLAAEYPEVHRLLYTNSFPIHFKDILAWLAGETRGINTLDSTIQAYGLTLQKEKYLPIRALLSKLIDRADHIADYLSLSAVIVPVVS